MRLDTALMLLEAAADPTRLRLLALLADGEAAVSELTTVLDQSQPRVSRHLRLLADAGLVENYRESRRVYYRLGDAAANGGIAAFIAGLHGSDDTVVATDRARMTALRQQRERAALHGQGFVGGAWPEGALAEALDDVLGGEPLGDLLDVGAGSGTLLRLLAPRSRSATGLDTATAMRELARARLHRIGLPRCSIRQGDAHALPFPAASFDVVVLDEVLGGSATPAAAVAEAARVLRPGGRLLVLDRILPAVRRLPALPASGAVRDLYENHVAMLLVAAGLQPGRRTWLPGRAPDRAVFSAAARSASRTEVGIPGNHGRTGTDD